MASNSPKFGAAKFGGAAASASSGMCSCDWKEPHTLEAHTRCYVNPVSMDPKAQLDALQRENEALKKEIASLKCGEKAKGAIIIQTNECPASFSSEDSARTLCVVVVGASGDLSVKKTYPALFSLFVHNLLPEKLLIFGYARSDMKDADFKAKISSKFPKKFEDKKEAFLSHCHYAHGQYDSAADFTRLNQMLLEKEKAISGNEGSNRIWYFAIPPSVFVASAKSIRTVAMTTSGWNRVIVEKPFGKDSESSAQLGQQLGALFTEEQIYRIDHYLGKEMVQNLMVLRFSNKVFEPIWNSDHIASVQITFKEDFGTQGRGGYFDEFGIIRDVMQNHLLQILSLVAMEPPVSLSAEDVRDEKVKVLRAIPPILRMETVVGQYGDDPKGKEGSYLSDPTVPKGSVTPTYACAILHINNARWSNTPFILKCGKALNERKAEIRIQFRTPNFHLFDDISQNELVLRVQPDEAVYLKFSTKKPGLDGGVSHTELDLSYKNRFAEEAKNLPDAYERLIYDVVRGDHNLFVRGDELVAAWKIFTPLLHELDRDKVKPVLYEYGGRGPKEAEDLISRVGYIRTAKYQWKPANL